MRHLQVGAWQIGIECSECKHLEPLFSRPFGPRICEACGTIGVKWVEVAVRWVVMGKAWFIPWNMTGGYEKKG